jgi:hypothetical protein
MEELRNELPNTESYLKRLDNISFILRVFFILSGGSLCITFTTLNTKLNSGTGEITYTLLGFVVLIIFFFLAYIIPCLIEWRREILLNMYHINYKMNKLTKNVKLLDDISEDDD